MPTDAASVFAEHATDLAERYDAPAADVEEGLRRLATTFRGERAGDTATLAAALRRPPLNLLADALAVMSAGDATRLIREADLPDLDRRVRTTAWLASPDTPLLSHEELGLGLKTLAAELHLDHDHSVKTGLPSRPYAVAPWLYHKLGRLYPTRQARSFVPHAERFTNARTDAPPYVWVQTPHRGVSGGGEFRECEYEQADFLDGLSAADGFRVEADRERLLGVKLSILARLVRVLDEHRAESLWDEILKILADTFSAPEVKFYVRLDGGRRAPNVTHLPSTSDPLSASDPRGTGGLTDWLEVAGHVEQELTVGTLTAARAALVGRGEARLRELTSQDVPPGRLHFAMLGQPERTDLDAAIDAAVARQEARGAFWDTFRKRAATAVQQVFRTPLVLPIATAQTPIVGPILGAYAQYAQQALADGRWPTAPPAELNVFRWRRKSWTVIFEGDVASSDAVGLFYLRLLLEYPGEEFDVRVLSRTRGLWEQDRTGPVRDNLIQALDDVKEDGASVGSPANDRGVVLDGTAMRAYEARAEQLNDLIGAAEEAHDQAECDRLRGELRQLNKQLTSARGLGGKPRRMGEEHKRARDAVVKAIAEAVEGFRDDMPALHRHLDAALHLGPECRYAPTAPVNWQF